MKTKDDEAKQPVTAIDERWNNIMSIACAEPMQILTSLLVVLKQRQLIARSILGHTVNGVPQGKEAIKMIQYLNETIKKTLCI